MTANTERVEGISDYFFNIHMILKQVLFRSDRREETVTQSLKHLLNSRAVHFKSKLIAAFLSFIYSKYICPVISYGDLCKTDRIVFLRFLFLYSSSFLPICTRFLRNILNFVERSDKEIKRPSLKRSFSNISRTVKNFKTLVGKDFFKK